MTADDDYAEDLRDWYAEDDLDGAQLLDRVHATLTKYVAFADRHQPVAVTLWTAATHGMPAWQHATRLVITSPQKRCGKSRLMDVTAGIAHDPFITINATTAAVYRKLGADDYKLPTLMVDEADALFGTKRAAEQNEDMRALANAGFQRGRSAWRCVGPQQIPTEFNTFAMAAFAAIGRLPDTITDRAVSIDLKRRSPGERVSKFRMRDNQKLVDLRGKLGAWVRDPERIKRLADAIPEIPVGIEDRAADAWEPLIATAEEAGGDWPRKARAACRALSDSAADADEDLGVLLLGDIREVFKVAGQVFLPSNQLVRELRDIEESPWGHGDEYELTVSKLAKRLKPFGVKPGHNAAKTMRGYSITGFHDAFRRYLRPDPSKRPGNDDDQHKQAENDETTIRPEPSEGVRTDGFTDGSGRFGDTSDISEESPKHAGQGDFSDGWTAPDGTPDGNGSRCRVCGDEIPAHMRSARARGHCGRSGCIAAAKRAAK